MLRYFIPYYNRTTYAPKESWYSQTLRLIGFLNIYWIISHVFTTKRTGNKDINFAPASFEREKQVQSGRKT